MTALQVIDQIKALDPRERAKVFDALREMETGTPQERPAGEDPAFRAVVDDVLGRHADLMRKLAQ